MNVYNLQLNPHFILIALNNIRYRIQYAYGEAFGLTASSVSYQQTVARVTLPL